MSTFDSDYPGPDWLLVERRAQSRRSSSKRVKIIFGDDRLLQRCSLEGVAGRYCC